VFLAGQTRKTDQDTSRQRDAIEIVRGLFHKNANPVATRHNRKVFYSFFPISSAAPGSGIALITATTAGFYLGDQENTSLSTVIFSPYITFSARIGFSLRPNLWLAGDKWEIMGDTRFLYYPQYAWELGGNTPYQQKLSINYKYVRFYQTILRAVKPYFLVGLGYNLDAHFDVDTFIDSASLAKFTGYPYGTAPDQNSLSSGVLVDILYDSRRNALNPLPGFYGNIVYRVNPRFLGSAQSWQSLYLDIRRYISFSEPKKNMIALWGFYWTALQSHTPFLDLPSIGWDTYQQRSGRGFAQNRYRGNRLLYFETEYRRDITADGLFGFVLFSNLNSISEPVTNQFSYIHIAAGGGLRLKLNKHSGTNICLDYGVSSHYSAVYLNLGETF
jgi:hypothetical protein